jgi:cell fate regulator YaaT (PSP1 superfamily)
MAKIQNLSLNPQKLSGTCGRLKCCLRYEFSYYFDELKRYPARESVYLTSKGEGVVEKIDIFTENVYLKYKNNEWDKIPLKDLEQCECIKSGTPLTMEGIETREEEIAAEAIESPWCQQNEINQDQNGLDEHPEAKKVPPGSD